MPIYTSDPCDDGFFPVEPSLRSSIGIGPKVTKAIDDATRGWLDEHPEATTTVEDDSLTNVKFKDGSVNSRVIENESITTDDIADLAVTTPKIADNAVTAAKIASAAVDGLRTMSTTQPGVAKVGAGLAMNDGAIELDGSGDIATAVTSWLNAHPEATTTVQDGSITSKKLRTGAVNGATVANDISEYLLQTGNLFDYRSITPGLVLDNGSISTSSSNSHSDYIPVKAEKTYIMTYVQSTAGGLYDEEKNFVTYFTKVSGLTDNYEWTSPIDGYIRINIVNTTAVNFVVSAGTTLKSYPPYGHTVLREDTLLNMEQFNDIDNFLQVESGNLFDAETVSEVGYYIDNSGNITPFTNHVYSDYIPVKVGVLYTATALLSSPGGFYDENKEYVSVIRRSGNTFTPNINGFVRINIQASTINTYAFSVGDTAKQYPPVGKKISNELIVDVSQVHGFPEIVSRWAGKKIVVFGDSRTWYDGQNYGPSTKSEWRGNVCVGYQEQLRELLGCEVVSRGTSGATSAQICTSIRAYDFSDADAVFLEGGVNDYVKQSQVTIGSIQPIGSTFDTSTVYGAWQSAVEYILTNYPSTIIYMDVPAIAWTANGVFPYDIAKIKGEVAELYNIPCLDLYKDGGINEVNRDYWYVDDVSQTNWRLHFNDYGNALLGSKMAGFINSR